MNDLGNVRSVAIEALLCAISRQLEDLKSDVSFVLSSTVAEGDLVEQSNRLSDCSSSVRSTIRAVEKLSDIIKNRMPME